MAGYPLLDHEGFCASVSTKKEARGRWMCWITYGRGHGAAAQASADAAPHRVPNDYASEEKAVLAAYEHARALIEQELVRH